MKKEVTFEDNGSIGYTPVAVYYDENNIEFDRINITIDSDISMFSLEDLQELADMSKQKLLEDLDNIFDPDTNSVYGNPDFVFKKHKNNYLNILKLKRAFNTSIEETW
jgi:hypothetical protein